MIARHRAACSGLSWVRNHASKAWSTHTLGLGRGPHLASYAERCKRPYATSSKKPDALIHDRFKSVLFVRKQSSAVADACGPLIQHVRQRFPDVRVFKEHKDDALAAEQWTPGTNSPPIDLLVTLGGDGTILHANSLFRSGPVPPVLSFSMGTLGFLLPFHVQDFSKALDSVAANKYTVLERMRLACSFQDAGNATLRDPDNESQVMNEVALHRGNSAHLNTIDIFVDGQHLTEAVSDGIIVSTPTGSTAYSLSAGGPIVHPTTSAILITPICPRSLSFRPLIFPATSAIRLQLSAQSRAPAGTYLDGQESHVLQPGQSVTIKASPHPMLSINRSSIPECESIRDAQGEVAGDDWVRDINSLLQYNTTFRSKGHMRHNS